METNNKSEVDQQSDPVQTHTLSPAVPPQPPYVPSSFLLTDQGNAERIVAKHPDHLRYVHDWTDWIVWTGTHWLRDRTGQVRRLFVSIAKAIFQEAEELAGDPIAKPLKKWAKESLSAGKVQAAVSLAANLAPFSVTSALLNTQKLYLNLRNCVFDLGSGKTLPHDPAYLITKMIPIDYDPTAKCPTWEKFLHRIFAGDTDLISYVQRAVGYSLTGEVKEQCFFFCYGSGQNGKSVFAEVLSALLGGMDGYASRAPSKMFMSSGNSSSPGLNPFLARLQSVRVLLASEIEEGKKWDEAMIKDVTGGEFVTARALRKNPVNFFPEFKLWFYGNHKPELQSVDKAMRRRLHLIPFLVTIPDAEKDPQLFLRLKEELMGILLWAIEGYRQYLLQGLNEPKAIRDATDEYFSESDVVSRFLSASCELRSDVQIEKAVLYAAFEAWCAEDAIFPLSHNGFGRKMKDRGFAEYNSGTARFWLGVCLKSAPAPDAPTV